MLNLIKKIELQTSNASIGILYHLAKNPQKQEKLRKEILTILPDKTSKLTDETMKSMPYLRACIKEAARLNPVVLGGLRSAGQNLVLQGYKVPKGVSIKSHFYFFFNEN